MWDLTRENGDWPSNMMILLRKMRIYIYIYGNYIILGYTTNNMCFFPGPKMAMYITTSTCLNLSLIISNHHLLPMKCAFLRVPPFKSVDPSTAMAQIIFSTSANRSPSEASWSSSWVSEGSFGAVTMALFKRTRGTWNDGIHILLKRKNTQ